MKIYTQELRRVCHLRGSFLIHWNSAELTLLEANCKVSQKNMCTKFSTVDSVIHPKILWCSHLYYKYQSKFHNNRDTYYIYCSYFILENNIIFLLRFEQNQSSLIKHGWLLIVTHFTVAFKKVVLFVFPTLSPKHKCSPWYYRSFWFCFIFTKGIISFSPYISNGNLVLN